MKLLLAVFASLVLNTTAFALTFYCDLVDNTGKKVPGTPTYTVDIEEYTSGPAVSVSFVTGYDGTTPLSDVSYLKKLSEEGYNSTFEGNYTTVKVFTSLANGGKIVREITFSKKIGSKTFAGSCKKDGNPQL